MFTIVYLENGNLKTYEKEFNTIRQVEVFAENNGFEEFMMVPMLSQRKELNFSKGIFDKGHWSIQTTSDEPEPVLSENFHWK